MRHYIKLFFKFAAIDLSIGMAYKFNFIIKSIACLLSDIISPLLTLVIYNTTSGIPGWGLYEFLLFQGTFMFIFGLAYTFSIRLPAHCIKYVREGKFDKVLVKPFNPLVYMTLSAVDIYGLTAVLGGLLIIGWSAFKININIWSVHFFSYLIILLVAFIFQYAVTILISSLSFLVVQSWALFDIFLNLVDLAKYPLTIYHTSLAFILTFIFPAAITANYPVEALLRGMSVFNMVKVSIPVVVFFILSLVLWERAIKKYTSAGG